MLVGAQTAGRKWINYEIKKAWNDGKGVVGVYINGLEDSNGNTTYRGADPFISTYGTGLASISPQAKCHVPSGLTSKDIYNCIFANLERWVEEAIASRHGLSRFQPWI